MSPQRRQDEAVRFRSVLVRGEIGQARELAVSLARDDASELLTLDALIEGVQQIARFDDCEAGEQLLQRCCAIQHDLGVRWIAWLWRAAAGVKSGRLDEGKAAVDTALAMVGPLGDYSRASTLVVRAAIDFFRGDLATARRWVVDAAGLYRQEHPDLHAQLWLAWGQIMLSLGQARAGLRALNQAAQAVDAAWTHVPLARQALLAKRPQEAADLLLDVAESGQSSDRVACMVKLVEETSEGLVPAEVISEYIWLSSRPITAEVANQLQAYIEEEQRHVGLRELFAWDLEEAGRFKRARQQFEALARSGDQRRAATAQRALAASDRRERERRVGLLDVIQTATWTKAAEGRQLAADTEAELFWARWTICNGEIEQADVDLACMAADASVERALIDAVQEGAIPLEVAREYVWIQQRPMTDQLVGVLSGFIDDNPALDSLRLIFARDLRAEGLRDEARVQLERVILANRSEEVVAAARREREALGERRDISKKLVTGVVSWKDYVTNELPWPSALDHNSLLFCGAQEDLPDVVLSAVEEVKIERGQPLSTQGEPGELLYLVRSGEIQASRMRQGHQELGSFGGGDYLGEIGTLYGLPNTATLTAAEESLVQVFSRRSLQRATQRSSAASVLKILREIYVETALQICPLYASADAALLNQVVSTHGRWRILQAQEPATFGERYQLAVLISGVARVVVSGHRGDVTLGFLSPGDLVLKLESSLVTVRAEKVTTLAVFEPAELEALSLDARYALGLYLNRCLSTLRVAEVLSEEEMAATSSDDPLQTLQRLAACS